MAKIFEAESNISIAHRLPGRGIPKPIIVKFSFRIAESDIKREGSLREDKNNQFKDLKPSKISVVLVSPCLITCAVTNAFLALGRKSGPISSRSTTIKKMYRVNIYDAIEVQGNSVDDFISFFRA